MMAVFSSHFGMMINGRFEISSHIFLFYILDAVMHKAGDNKEQKFNTVKNQNKFLVRKLRLASLAES